MDPGDGKRGMLGHLPAPVGQNACRADHHEMCGTGIFKGHHCSNRLHGLSQSHLVTEKNSSLVERILDTPFLISSQGAQKAVLVTAFLINLPGKLLRKSVYLPVTSQKPRTDILQVSGVSYGILFKIFPCRPVIRCIQSAHPLQDIAGALTVIAPEHIVQLLIGIISLLLYLR